ncbi:MAG: flagellar export protein FliJ [Desulfobulbaceae bacterium A2]|nr:MAG: flagellar export protein FliJ [Desulfobulbaceae bacterium A2]
MKPFAMEPVLRYREQLENIAQQHLLQAMEQEAAAQARHDHLTTALATNYDALERLRREGTLVEQLLLFERHNEVLREALLLATSTLHEARDEVASRRKALLKTSQDKKVLEKLKHHQDLLYRRHLDRLERRQLDEIAVMRHHREH